MNCPKCQAGNPDGMKFCGECGAKLERVCPRCHFPNPPQFKFCGQCGHDLTPPKEAPSLDYTRSQYPSLRDHRRISFTLLVIRRGADLSLHRSGKGC